MGCVTVTIPAVTFRESVSRASTIPAPMPFSVAGMEPLAIRFEIAVWIFVGRPIF